MKNGIIVTFFLMSGFLISCVNGDALDCYPQENLETQANKDGALAVSAESVVTEFMSEEVPSADALSNVEQISSDSRTGFKPDGRFFWNEGDELAVKLVDWMNPSQTSVANFSICDSNSGESKGPGFPTALFQGVIESTKQIGDVAVSPYIKYDATSHNKPASFRGDNIVFSYPALYTYESVDNSLPTVSSTAQNLRTYKNFNHVMAGLIQKNKVVLKHLGGFVWIKIEKMPMSAGTFFFKTDKKIVGEYVIAQNKLNGTPQFVVQPSTQMNEQKIAINFKGATQNGTGYFYIPLPTGTYENGFTIAFAASLNGAEQYTYSLKNAVTITRKKAHIYTLSSLNAN